MGADKARAGPRKHGPRAATLAFSPAWVWVVVTLVFGVLWLGGVAFEAPYATGRGLFRLCGLMFLV